MLSIRQHTSTYARSAISSASKLFKSAYVSIRQHTPAYVSIRQHTPAPLFPALRSCSNQHTSAYASIHMLSIRQHTSAYVLPALFPNTSADVSIRQQTSAYLVSIREDRCSRWRASEGPAATSAYVSIRQHTPAYVSIRQHTSA
jgi:hypothetical protein